MASRSKHPPEWRGSAIRRLRYMLGRDGLPITQTDLAKLLGVHQRTVSYWERELRDSVPLQRYRDKLDSLYREASQTEQARDIARA